jgi:predicted acylesterase/phospholipase RssA
MKGGITSGVVYPLALVELAKKYRFANIGGTSAGAIAAAAAAAGEYGRGIPGAGFERLEKIPGEVGPNLLSLFQPTPALRPLFDTFPAALRAKGGIAQIFAIIIALINGYWLSALVGLLPGIINTLPMQHDDGEPDRRFAFKRSEWEKIFPAEVMQFLVQNCDPFEPKPDEAGEFYHFPDEARLPLIVGARMSLSFPVLISAVPLWRRDYTLQAQSEKDKLRRCLFSDGGLSSNFPIHFFDHLFPNSPTFAISLDEFDARRNRDHVWLPKSAGSGIPIPVLPFAGLGGFVMRLVYSAKDWQDNLQSTLPGYREGIVHVALTPDEGGLNLTMSQETINQLIQYGKDAGDTLCNEFDMDQHRWRRFLVSMARMEETLDEVAKAYAQIPGEFGKFLADFEQTRTPYRSPNVPPEEKPAYAQDTKDRVDEMLKRADELEQLGRRWRTPPTIREGNIPKPATHLRITPRY